MNRLPPQIKMQINVALCFPALVLFTATSAINRPTLINYVVDTFGASLRQLYNKQIATSN